MRAEKQDSMKSDMESAPPALPAMSDLLDDQVAILHHLADAAWNWRCYAETESLRQLMRMGLVELDGDQDQFGPHRYYRLTTAGRRFMAASRRSFKGAAPGAKRMRNRER